MLPSTGYTNDPISDPSIFHIPLFHDMVSNSKQDHVPFSSYLSLMNYENGELNLHHHHDLFSYTNDFNHFDLDSNIGMDELKQVNDKKTCQGISKGRSSKKDRHSKISTAKGLRDRRMRISREVAREFFDLQDMLGFDKGSKTIEWLLNKAKPKIKELARNIHYNSSVTAKTASSTSECEVLSSNCVEEVCISTDKPSRCLNKVKKKRQLRKTSFHPIAKASRERARERARERTRDKKHNEETKSELNILHSWSAFGAGEKSGTHYEKINPLIETTEVEKPSSYNQQSLGTSVAVMDDDFGGIMSKWSPSSMFSYQYSTLNLQEHQFADFQFYGKS